MTVEGLEAFGKNLAEISKTLRKQLATGVCVKDNLIEIQGKCLYDLAMFINKTLKV